VLRGRQQRRRVAVHLRPALEEDSRWRMAAVPALHYPWVLPPASQTLARASED